MNEEIQNKINKLKNYSCESDFLKEKFDESLKKIEDHINLLSEQEILKLLNDLEVFFSQFNQFKFC